MSAPTPGTSSPETTAPGTTSLAPTTRRLWTRSRGLLAGLLVLLLGGAGLALLRSGDQHGRLDPRSVDRYGSGAVAALLADHGVDTRVVTTTEEAAAAAGPDTTVLVTDPNLLTRRQLDTLHQATGRRAGRTVLLTPGPAALDVFAPRTEAGTPTDVKPLSPGCSLPAARAAGDAELGGLRYSTSVRLDIRPQRRPLLPERRRRHPAAPALHDRRRHRPPRRPGHLPQPPARRTRQRLARPATARLAPSSGLVPPLRQRPFIHAGRPARLLRPHPLRLALGTAPALRRRRPRGLLAGPPARPPRPRAAAGHRPRRRDD